MKAWHETPAGRRMPLSERIAMVASFGLLALAYWMIRNPDTFALAVMAVIP